MIFRDLPHYLQALNARGDCININEPLAVRHASTELHRRLLESGGPAFVAHNPVDENGQKYHFPLVHNIYGSVERIAFSINKKPDDLRQLGHVLAGLQKPEPPKGLKDLPKIWEMVKIAKNMRQNKTKHAPCQEVIYQGDKVNLNILPITTNWAGDIAPLITWGIVVSQGPNPDSDNTDGYNMGIYRMQVVGKNQVIMRWLKHRGGAQHHQKWGKKRPDPFPVAVVLGANPATTLAAVMPLPDNLSEYKFAGFLQENPLELVQCLSHNLCVPAHSEIILEGYISFDDYRLEGPYGDHTGYYNDREYFPVMTITAITHRRGAHYLSTYTGRPPDEPAMLGLALNEVFIPIFQQQYPEVVDFYLPPEGCSYRVAVVSIKKQYAGQAKRVMMGVWSFLRQFIYTKMVIIVDDDIDCRNWLDVIWAISTRMDAKRDITIIDNTPIDYLDFASPVSGLGSKIGLDATNKAYPETTREWGHKIDMPPHITNDIDELMKKLGI